MRHRIFPAFVVLAFAACSRHAAVNLLASSAYRPDRVVTRTTSSGMVLAGDMHCHVAPPDDRSDVIRTLPETIALARDEGLDFVVLTPHVPARFFADSALRDEVARDQRRLRRAIARTATHGVLLVAGFEYTDHDYGHVGLAFADLDRVLAEVPIDVARAHPERFFERWVANGGTLVVHHPLVTPLRGAPVAMAAADLSWRPWTSRASVPSEIRAIDRLATGFEAFNLAASHLRDRYLLGNHARTLTATLRRIDTEIVRQRRRITPTGGSDSHSGHLRATTFVIAASRSEEAVRDALVGGRVCLRDRAACTFEARAPGGPWVSVGGTLRGTTLEVRAAADAEILLDGRPVADVDAGDLTRVSVTPGCHVVRAIAGEGFSAPIYAGCF